jgi:hypothetical protein
LQGYALQHLSAPWRSEYIKSLERHTAESTGCFLCDAASVADAWTAITGKAVP